MSLEMFVNHIEGQ